MIKPNIRILRDGKSYIDRWFLIPRNRWLNVYLHHGVLSDYLTPHDHPWWNISVILKGAYLEHQYEVMDGKRFAATYLRKRFHAVFRRATQLHRIELCDNKPFWSLFITGPLKRTWGFQTKDGWISHEVILDIDRIKGTSKIKPEYEKEWK